MSKGAAGDAVKELTVLLATFVFLNTTLHYHKLFRMTGICTCCWHYLGTLG
jgi:hypothetical protein